jgi:hypothetical protein
LVVSKSQSNIKNGLVTTSGYFFVREEAMEASLSAG